MIFSSLARISLPMWTTSGRSFATAGSTASQLASPNMSSLSPRLSILDPYSLPMPHPCGHLCLSSNLRQACSPEVFGDVKLLQEVSLRSCWCPGPSHRCSQGFWQVLSLSDSGLRPLVTLELHQDIFELLHISSPRSYLMLSRSTPPLTENYSLPTLLSGTSNSY